MSARVLSIMALISACGLRHSELVERLLKIIEKGHSAKLNLERSL
jgi:hypothetical protein